MVSGFRHLIKSVLICVIIQGVIGQQCGSKKEVAYARIPELNTLLSLEEFDTHIAGREMGEVYFALPRPAAFVPDINYKSTITKDPGSSQYTQATKGETLTANPTCASGSASLTPVYGINRALFFREFSVIQGVYIHGNMNDAPITDIIEDLCRATGVKFGSPSLEWYFSFGENSKNFHSSIA
ncbi:uncharacterized protein LOC132722609 [Ruditapes philippinarum]|uniref:uncharacterized protein LOC132722609 n=1 Tax=Ruditapes philippinarum TaxID=129788 RepID=UPI00295B7AB4|nr:uncharacterized protein LOC132722609 [Ruditapes philippinarum]